MTHMTNAVDIIKTLSPVKRKHQAAWDKISDRCVKQGKIEHLTTQGLLQAIDRLAWEIASDGQWCATSNLSDEECDIILEPRIKQMDEIIHVVALASGIHPTSIDFVVGLRSDYYISEYINMIEGD